MASGALFSSIAFWQENVRYYVNTNSELCVTSRFANCKEVETMAGEAVHCEIESLAKCPASWARGFRLDLRVRSNAL